MNEDQSSMNEFANGDVKNGQSTNVANGDISNCNIDRQITNTEASNNASSSEGINPAANKQNDDDDDNKKLFVGGLARDITEDQLKTHFSEFGEVCNINIKSDLMTKRPRGFAFVSFKTCDAVVKALKSDSHSINGKSIDPKKAKARPKPPPMKKIFVGGLSPDTSEQDVVKYFERFGKVENVELPFDKLQNKRRAFCFVCFETEKSAADAAAQPKQVIPPMTKQCDIKIATPPKPEPYGFQPMFALRGRDRFRNFPGFSGFNYGGGYTPNFNYGSGFNQGYTGYNGSYGAYDYCNSGGYGNGSYSGNNYEAGYWNFNQNNYGGGYGESQCSDDYTRDTM